MRIFLGLIGIVLSLLLIIKRERVQRFTGTISWAERHLGMGGTFTLYVLIGIFGFFFSLMYMTNSFDALFGGLNQDLFKSVK